MKKLTGGLINTTYLSGNKVKKIYSDDSLIKGLGFNSLQRMKNELTALERYSKNTPIFVPKIINENKEKRTLVVENISGEPIERLLINKSEDLNFKNLDLKISELLKTIHKETQGDNNYIIQKYTNNFSDFLRNSESILTYEDIDLEKLEATISSCLKLESFLKCPTTFIHGDFWLDNMLLSSKDTVFIIDWEFSGFGMFYEDLGIFYTNVDRFFQDINLGRFYQNYSKNLDYRLIKLFCLYRCIRLLSFINLDIYKKSRDDYNHSFKSLVRIIKNVLDEV